MTDKIVLNECISYISIGVGVLNEEKLLPIVPAFLWCALPSRQALLMLLVVLVRLWSSPPDNDSKLDCMNLSLRPTWSTLSMLKWKRQINEMKTHLRYVMSFCLKCFVKLKSFLHFVPDLWLSCMNECDSQGVISLSFTPLFYLFRGTIVNLSCFHTLTLLILIPAECGSDQHLGRTKLVAQLLNLVSLNVPK